MSIRLAEVVDALAETGSIDDKISVREHLVGPGPPTVVLRKDLFERQTRTPTVLFAGHTPPPSRHRLETRLQIRAESVTILT